MVAQGKRACLVEIVSGEAGLYPAKIENGKEKPESHYVKYKVLTDGDAAEVTVYGERGSKGAPPVLKFVVGSGPGASRTVAALVGTFKETNYGLQCRADKFELYTA